MWIKARYFLKKKKYIPKGEKHLRKSSHEGEVARSGEEQRGKSWFQGEAKSSLDGGKHPSKRKRFSIDFYWYQVINLSFFYKFMLDLIVLSSITKKGEIVTNMASFMPFRVILVIE